MYIVRVYTETTDTTLPKRFRNPSSAEVAAKVYLHRNPSAIQARVMTPDRKLMLKQIDREDL